MKQDTTQATPFELVYSRIAILSVKIEVKTYLTEPITEENFQKTLLRRTYNLMETLENKWRKAVDNIQKSQEKQKKRHNNQLPDKPVEFKNRDKVLLHHTKVEKQWSEKFNLKWNRPFHIEKILGNKAYKLRLNNKILTKAAHRDQLKLYQNIISILTSNISQLRAQKILV
ncbi:hypothetical protein G9A89_019435 [Geosiphon pyriformis]|nr:hypothetical protein G9A89_019435 [Geosiphon pyriformis]